MDPIEALVADFAEQRERGEAVEVDGFLACHPEGGEALRVALEALVRTEALFPEPDLPASVGPYRVLREIGRGGMGRVLEVERDGRIYALKLLHAALEDQTRALERFRREGEALSRLRHDGVVVVHATGLHGARPYIAMELVRGESLAAFVARARASGLAGRCVDLPGDGNPAERAAQVVAGVARAVAAAHAAGVLHRDLNPRNVLLREDGSPVVIDFGLVRSSGTPTLTATGDMLGTPPYLSPEQARGERADAQSDVFGLGTILYELLTATPPRAGTETLALLREAATRPLRPPRRLNPAVPRALDTIVRRATSWRGGWRYASADELAFDLERFLRGEKPRARPPGVAERALGLWLTRRGGVLAAAAALILAAAFAIARARPPSPEALERLSRDAHHRATIAWLDGDLPAMAREVEALGEVRPQDPLLSTLAALAAGALPAKAEHPAARAFLEGEALLRAGQPADALARFETAHNVLPGVPILVASIGVAAAEAGEFERAQEMLEQAAPYLAASRMLHRRLAEVYLATGSPADTVKAASAAIALDPAGPVPRLLLARGLLGVGDAPGASAALRDAVARGANPTSAAALRAQIERAP